MEGALSSSKSGAARETVAPFFGERFTQRLEAFSDLVFGFSLSLLATRLEVPASPADVFEPTRWGTFIVTFGMICGIWVAHYRIFRHHFVAQIPDVAVNFIFLLGIAVLPYAVQTFLRFPSGRDATILYFGDFALIFVALATLRWRALLQRRGDPDGDVRLREWRGTVRQYIIAGIIAGSLVAMNGQLPSKNKFFSVVLFVLFGVALATRLVVRRLPKFLE
jgi:uncharacterized membrane protein